MASAKLGILAGGGDLPLHLARAARATGREVFVLALQGEADPSAYLGLPHGSVSPVKVGEVLDRLRSEGCEEVVLAGRVARPDFNQLKPDWRGAKLMPRVLKASRQGDDAILRVFLRFLEDEGFRVVGADQVAGELVTPQGVLGRHRPSERDHRDAARAVAALAMLDGPDVGQAAVVGDGRVLAVEAVAGTDDMLARLAKSGRRGGVLVKMARSGQDRRVDLPTIGPNTVEGCRAAGLAGIALEAGGSLIIDRDAVIAAADGAGMFLSGVLPDGRF